MRKSYLISSCLFIIAIALISFRDNGSNDYRQYYDTKLAALEASELSLLNTIATSDLKSSEGMKKVREAIELSRHAMKDMDVWLRYLEPQAYRKINGPLPVEWETEVFEKFEKPYKREGAGLALALLYLEEPKIDKDSLTHLIDAALAATRVFAQDSITRELNSYHHFYLCNRLMLLNLAAIYTTGFECPDPDQVIPELRTLLATNTITYQKFNNSFPATPLTTDYLALYGDMVAFVAGQPDDHTRFDHFTFVQRYVNPLFIINQQLIAKYKVVSHSLVDYSLNKNATSIFDKNLYNGQNTKGIFIRVKDDSAMALIERTGKLLFNDPILSGNNMRSCASCHKPEQYFTDTSFATALQYNNIDRLTRNSPTLLNADYNHLVMLDGKHSTLQDQTKAVIGNPQEMGCNEQEVLKKVLSCKDYKKTFRQLLAYTPQEKEITYDHIVSCITVYYSKLSKYYSPFDEAMNNKAELPAAAKQGYNLFMGKAQCATCHFAPQFNGVKPPYIGSEFEVIGVPSSTQFTALSSDEGRYIVNPASETKNAFRTGTVRNSKHTAPYMHNGVFRTMAEVIDFYDGGGGNGHSLKIDNQTLSADSLHLTPQEKINLEAFIESLNENIPTEEAPKTLPHSRINALNTRKPGGTY